MINKTTSRMRRAKPTRHKIAELKISRLTVHRSNSHIYAQVIGAGRVLASASSNQGDIRKDLASGSTVKAAAAVGKLIAEKAIAAGVSAVAFDRSGFAYHGRVKALAEAAREAGLKF